MPENQIKDRLKKIREHLGLSQQGIANKLGVLVTTISKYERGIIKPSSDFLIKIHAVFNVNLNWLIAGQENMFLDKNFIAEEYYMDSIKEKIGFNNQKIELIIKEIVNSPLLLENIKDFIKIKKGDKNALKDLKKVIKGIEFMIE